MAKDDLTAQRLRELLDYDPETGEFRWRVTRSHLARAGSIAGSPSVRGGYICIKIDGTLYRAHRLAWLYCFGTWPSQQIDHRDKIRTNNRIANLRDVSGVTNMQNQTLPSRNNACGLLGVSQREGRWRAQIWAQGRKHCLGTFPTPELAREAYLAAKRALHPGFIDQNETPTLISA